MTGPELALFVGFSPAYVDVSRRRIAVGQIDDRDISDTRSEVPFDANPGTAQAEIVRKFSERGFICCTLARPKRVGIKPSPKTDERWITRRGSVRIQAITVFDRYQWRQPIAFISVRVRRFMEHEP